MEKHAKLVIAVVRKQVLGDLAYEEALQAGRIGLWRAILNYDPDRGVAFSTYAWPSIARHIWRAVKAEERFVRRTAVPCTALSAKATDPALVWERRVIDAALHALVQRQSMRLRVILVARYGLDGYPAAFYGEIGQRLHLSGERVRQLHNEALARVRHPAQSQHLRVLLGLHTVADYERAEEQTQRWLRKRGGRHD
jgi:RNA polymerase sigma factor (sigma-70 family)